MNIIVCFKQVLDPEMPPAKFKIDTQAKRVVAPEGIRDGGPMVDEVDLLLEGRVVTTVGQGNQVGDSPTIQGQHRAGVPVCHAQRLIAYQLD
jgi:hypothetical protein